MAVCRSAAAQARQACRRGAWGQAGGVMASPASCAACGAAVARMTASNSALHASSPACQCTRQPAFSACRPCTRWPMCRRAPRSCSQRSAGPGHKSPKGTRGSSRLEPPRMPKSASRSTRKKTAPLASCMAVFRAETQSGSMKSRSSCPGRPRHKSATLACGPQAKPPHCQASARRSSASRARQGQPRARAMPQAASSGAGSQRAAGSASPVPSG